MKHALLVVIMLTITTPAFAELPFGFFCDADDDEVELALCDSVSSGLLSSSSIRKAVDADIAWYVAVIIPMRHPGEDKVSAGVDINYVDRRCGNYLISVHSAILITAKDELNTPEFAAFIEHLRGGVVLWNREVLPAVVDSCIDDPTVLVESQ